jgi:hypothetical protein
MSVHFEVERMIVESRAKFHLSMHCTQEYKKLNHVLIKFLTALTYILHFSESWNGSVVIATGYELNGQGLTPSKGKIFLSSTVFRLDLGPTQPPIQWVLGALSPGLKSLAREADYSPPSNAEVKNGGAIPPLSHISSWLSAKLIMHNVKFTFFTTFSIDSNVIHEAVILLIVICVENSVMEVQSCALENKFIEINTL